MEANTYSGGTDPDDVLGAPIQFWKLGSELYHRNADTGRVFRIVINTTAMQASLANEADEERGEVVREPGVAIDEDRLAEIGRDVAGAARYEEVPPGVIGAPGLDPIPLTERQLDPAVADEILDIADEIDLHCFEVPLARLVPGPVAPVIPVETELVLVVLVARPGVTASRLADEIGRRGGQTDLESVGVALAKLKRDGKAASTRHGARAAGLTWKATDRGVAEAASKIRPALLALAAA